MKKVFLNIWQWLFGNKKGVEITAPLEKPTMNIPAEKEPEQDKVEAILSQKSPQPVYSGENLATNIGNKIEKFEVDINGSIQLLTKKQLFFYLTIRRHQKISSEQLCFEFLKDKYGYVPKNLPQWNYSAPSAHKKTINYLLKIKAIEKSGKFYSAN